MPSHLFLLLLRQLNRMPAKMILIWATLVAWALWLGGIIAVFVFGSYFRRALPDDVFHQAAHAMFHVFGYYEVIVCSVALLGSSVLLVSYPSKQSVLLLAIIVLTWGMMIAFTMGMLPAMDWYLEQGNQAVFLKLHIKSMIALAIQAVLLLIAGVIILSSNFSGKAPGVESSVDSDAELSFERPRHVPRGL
jgi:Domain of unknown function (DUF4149)